MRQRRSLASHSRTFSRPAQVALALLLVLIGSTVVLVLDVAASPAIPVSATDAMKVTIGQIINILNDHELKRLNRSEERRRHIEEAIRGRVSFEEMARQALGSTWRTLDDGERREFVELFVHLLRDVFANRLFDYSDEQVHYLDERSRGRYTEVRTRLSGSKVDIPIVYRLMNTPAGWRVFDVVIDEVGIVSNYRAQFIAIIQKSSYANLVNQMRRKGLTVKLFEREPSP